MTDISNGPTGITEPPTIIHGANGPAGSATTYSLNIQPATLVKAMMESEPCLFANASPVQIDPSSVDPKTLFVIGLMTKAARWHAQLQVDFWRELTVVDSND